MKNYKCLVAIAAVSVASLAAAQEISATVNGDTIDFPDVRPVMMNGRVMVPVRGVFEKMNSTVMWDASAGMVTAQRGKDVIKLPINSRTATVNGREVSLDTPAMVRNGRTMVPLRFLSETLGASVQWQAASRNVEISTTMVFTHEGTPGYTMRSSAVGTVIPFTFNRALSSNNSSEGDKFTGTLVTDGDSNYQHLPSGTIFEGHVDVARAKTGKTPGVLGLAFDRVVLPDGQSYPLSGSTIGLDSKSVIDRDGRLVAKSGAKNESLKYVGYGAGAGALVSLVTKKGNLLTNSLIGGALGFLFGETQKKQSPRDVTLETGTKSGIRLTRELSFKVKDTDNTSK